MSPTVYVSLVIFCLCVRATILFIAPRVCSLREDIDTTYALYNLFIYRSKGMDTYLPGYLYVTCSKQVPSCRVVYLALCYAKSF